MGNEFQPNLPALDEGFFSFFKKPQRGKTCYGCLHEEGENLEEKKGYVGSTEVTLKEIWIVHSLTLCPFRFYFQTEMIHNQFHLEDPNVQF